MTDERVGRQFRTRFIVNPQSAGGRTARRFHEIRRMISESFADAEICTTARPGDGTVLAAEAIQKGFELVVAVGGDGTAHEVVNGLVSDGADRASAAFSIVPSGTGSDLRKTLEIPTGFQKAVQHIASSRLRSMDLMRIEFVDHQGQPASRICVNVAGFGLEGDIVRRVNESGKKFGGTFSFLAATGKALMEWRCPTTTLSWIDDQGLPGRWDGNLLSCFLANGSFCGGGMNVAPSGSPFDGVIDMTIMAETPLLSQAPHLFRLYNGTLEKLPGAVAQRVQSVECTVDGTALVPIDVDGEQPGVLPMKMAALPKALDVCC